MQSCDDTRKTPRQMFRGSACKKTDKDLDNMWSQELVPYSSKSWLFGTGHTDEASEIRSEAVFGRKFTGREHL